MVNKAKGYKDARAIEGMHSVTFYPEDPVFGKGDIDEVPEEHRQRCALVSWPMGGPERVFTESEVRGMLSDVAHTAGNTDLIWSELRRIAEKHGVSLDPA